MNLFINLKCKLYKKKTRKTSVDMNGIQPQLLSSNAISQRHCQVWFTQSAEWQFQEKQQYNVYDSLVLF